MEVDNVSVTMLFIFMAWGGGEWLEGGRVGSFGVALVDVFGASLVALLLSSLVPSFTIGSSFVLLDDPPSVIVSSIEGGSEKAAPKSGIKKLRTLFVSDFFGKISQETNIPTALG